MRFGRLNVDFDNIQLLVFPNVFHAVSSRKKITNTGTLPGTSTCASTSAFTHVHLHLHEHRRIRLRAIVPHKAVAEVSEIGSL